MPTLACPWCRSGRLFAADVDRRGGYTEMACFSCGWVEYHDHGWRGGETRGERMRRLAAHELRTGRAAET